MNVDSLITQVYYRTGRASAITAGTFDTETLYALNQTLREVNLSINFQELMAFDKTSLSLTASTQAYSLPSDFLKMIQIWSNDSFSSELMRITPPEYKVYLDNVDTDTGTDPTYYDILGESAAAKQIYFFPYRASVETGSITAFADYSGTVAGTVLATDASHGLGTGNTITIVSTGGTFDGTYTVTYVSSDTFYFTLAWPGATDTATWTRKHYIPMVYIKKVTDMAAGGSANVISTYYPDLLIEGAAYYLYRDSIYHDQPEKIAFRQQQYARQIELAKVAQSQPDRISRVLPKRLLPTKAGKMYYAQTSGYQDN